MPKVTVSNPDKLIYPKDKITKAEVVAYYQMIAPYMIPFIKDRPLSLQRFPNGIDEEGFFQKNAPDYYPAWIERCPIESRGEERTINYVICNKKDTLLYLVNALCLTFHPWLSKKKKLNYPDKLIVDLDPSKKGFAEVKKIALDLKDIFEQLSLTPFVMTTGSRGLHVVVPLDAKTDFDRTRSFAQRLLHWYQEEHSNITTMEMSIKKRGTKIFLDALRNAYAQTGVAPYSLRPYKGAPIATPLAWQELADSKLTSQTYNINNIEQRLKKIKDPWAAFNRTKGSIARAEKLLDKLIEQ